MGVLDNCTSEYQLWTFPGGCSLPALDPTNNSTPPDKL